MDRRTFCISGAAAALGRSAWGQAAAAAPCWPIGPARAAPPALPRMETPVSVATVLFDSRFAPSREFGAAAAHDGRATAVVHGDLTGLWQRQLRPQWAAGAALAGMTSATGLLCLEQLAMDHWMHVVVRVEHHEWAAGVAHRVSAAPRTAAGICAALAGLDADAEGYRWPALMSRLLAGCPRAKDRPHCVRMSPAASRLAGDGRAPDLVSWIIAP